MNNSQLSKTPKENPGLQAGDEFWHPYPKPIVQPPNLSQPDVKIHPMALRTYKYRIYPTPSQQRALVNILNQCRWVYNNTLAFRKQENKNTKNTKEPIVPLIPLSVFPLSNKNAQRSNKSILRSSKMSVDDQTKASKHSSGAYAPGKPQAIQGSKVTIDTIVSHSPKVASLSKMTNTSSYLRQVRSESSYIDHYLIPLKPLPLRGLRLESSTHPLQSMFPMSQALIVKRKLVSMLD